MILLILRNYGWILILSLTFFSTNWMPISCMIDWVAPDPFLFESNYCTCDLLLISIECTMWCCNLHFTTFLAESYSFLAFVACDNSICFESNGVDNDGDLLSERLLCSKFYQNDSIRSWKMRMSNLSTFRHRSVNIISVSFVIRAYPLTINSECLFMPSLK